MLIVDLPSPQTLKSLSNSNLPPGWATHLMVSVSVSPLVHHVAAFNTRDSHGLGENHSLHHPSPSLFAWDWDWAPAACWAARRSACGPSVKSLTPQAAPHHAARLLVTSPAGRRGQARAGAGTELPTLRSTASHERYACTTRWPQHPFHIQIFNPVFISEEFRRLIKLVSFSSFLTIN